MIPISKLNVFIVLVALFCLSVLLMDRLELKVDKNSDGINEIHLVIHGASSKREK